jgi:hypothetical protein
MMRRMIIDEQEAAAGRLWLLRGCPRRWFAAGKSIAVAKAPTLFGPMALRMHSLGGTITVDVDLPVLDPPKEIRLVVRHPERKAIAGATVNGQTAKIDGETIVLRSASGRVRVVCTYQWISSVP